MSDLSVAQHLPLSIHQLLEEVNGRVVIGREKDTHLTCKEVVDLPLPPIIKNKIL